MGFTQPLFVLPSDLFSKLLLLALSLLLLTLLLLLLFIVDYDLVSILQLLAPSLSLGFLAVLIGVLPKPKKLIILRQRLFLVLCWLIQNVEVPEFVGVGKLDSPEELVCLLLVEAACFNPPAAIGNALLPRVPVLAVGVFPLLDLLDVDARGLLVLHVLVVLANAELLARLLEVVQVLLAVDDAENDAAAADDSHVDAVVVSLVLNLLEVDQRT